jgi:hypothetical protein
MSLAGHKVPGEECQDESDDRNPKDARAAVLCEGYPSANAGVAELRGGPLRVRDGKEERRGNKSSRPRDGRHGLKPRGSIGHW